MITTDSVANPKPVREINWLGNPVQPGETYYGPKSVSDTPKDTQEPRIASVSRVKRKRSTSRISAWTAEKRAAYGQRMREWHAKRKAASSSDAAGI